MMNMMFGLPEFACAMADEKGASIAVLSAPHKTFLNRMVFSPSVPMGTLKCAHPSRMRRLGVDGLGVRDRVNERFVSHSVHWTFYSRRKLS
jgi:hypothetical protein